MEDYLAILRLDPELQAEYPGTIKDRLFEASYNHLDDQKSCMQLGCSGELVSRSRLENAEAISPAVHFGLMASGDLVMKSGEDRDRIAAAEGVIGFEMEGAGVWDSFPCIVVKAACDYADSHKSKDWQRYAAATAAACAKALLSFWVPSPSADNLRSVQSNESDLSPDKRIRMPLPEGASSDRESRDHPVFLVPFSKNPIFVGRDEALAKLRSLFFERNQRKVALLGLGGIGKTQIALQFAFLLKQNKPDYSIFWLPAYSMASFEQECAKFVKTLGIRCSDGEDAREVVRQYLNSEDSGSWFLIVDNADDINVFRRSTTSGGGILAFLPTNNDNGCILLTTRSKEVAVALARKEIMKLPHMGFEDASDLLEKSLIDDNGPRNDQAVAKLLNALSFHPLAISQAAAYMNTYEASIEEYSRLLSDRDERSMVELLEQGHDDDTYYHSSQSAVATTWIMSFDRIRRSDPAAAKILSFMAFIEPKSIPRSILPSLETEQQSTHALGTLLGHGFLTQREGDRDTMFDMHSLVHLATRRWNEKEGRGKEMQLMSLARVAEVFPTDDWENREVWRQYLPHALRLLTSMGDAENDDVCKLGFWVGRCLCIDGRPKEAVARLEPVVAITVKTLAEDDPHRLESQHALADAYRGNGQKEKAIELLENIVAIREKILVEDHPHLLTSQHELAVTYLLDSQRQKAIELLAHVVATRERVLAENHLHRLTSQDELTIARLIERQRKKAIQLLEHVVRTREKVLEEGHPHRLTSQQELARAYLAEGQKKKAVELLKHVVAIRENTLAEDHPNRLTSQYELARAYLAEGLKQKAVKLLEHIVATRNKALAEDHPHRLGSQQELAGAYLAQGKKRKATKLLEHVVAIREKTLRENHPHRLGSQQELAIAYLANGQRQKAIELLEHMVATREKTLAENTQVD
ncbi:hypothetical protein FSARC_13197 [Fusarium sarcochroum]|uniref:NB-ARC domain-containing protein n=1 Tax=Fusarium sarcochroum TaxID=1208366 RepID=A0A8H4T362_9HYPO|nr:hypothetical protein FSARC_13197 [Fusarium sarcochroum]